MLVKTLLVLVLLISSCRKASDVKGNKVLNINLGRQIDTLDPAISYDTVSSTVLYQTYEPLFQYHYLKRPYTIIPLLAEELPKVDPSGKVYTIKIKKNVRYHESKAFKDKVRTVKAQDFINQIKRLAFKGTKSNGWFLFENRIVGLDEFREKAGTDLKKFKELKVAGLVAKDDYTLEIKLKAPYPQLLYALAMNFTAPIPLEVIDHYNNNLSQVTVGTGPFYITQMNPRLSVELKKNPNYREEFYPAQGDRLSNDLGLLKDAGKKVPFLDGIKFHIILEDQPRWLNFLSKKIDVLTIPKDNFNTAIQDDGTISKNLIDQGIKLQVSPTLTYYWISFNMKDPILGKNKYLRYAIAHAIDIERYIKLFTNNTGQQAFSIYPPGIPGYSPSNKLVNEFNLDKAKEFMKKAGFENGNGLPAFTFDSRGNTNTSRQRVEFIKNQLAKIGVKIDIRMNSFPGFLKKARSGDLQIWLDGWALDYPDSENILQLLVTKNHTPGPNSTFFSSKEFDKMFEKLKMVENGPEKYKLMSQMETLVHEQMPWVMLFYNRKYVLYYDHVHNYRYSGIAYNYLKYLRLKK